jgi:hypothetical protein
MKGFGPRGEKGCNSAGTKWRTNNKRGREVSPPLVIDIEFFRSVQEEVSLGAVDEARRNLPDASLQYLRVEHRAVRRGEASPVWRSVERASTALVWVTSGLDSLITAVGVISSVLRHRAALEG